MNFWDRAALCCHVEVRGKRTYVFSAVRFPNQTDFTLGLCQVCFGQSVVDCQDVRLIGNYKTLIAAQQAVKREMQSIDAKLGLADSSST